VQAPGKWEEELSEPTWEEELSEGKEGS